MVKYKEIPRTKELLDRIDKNRLTRDYIANPLKIINKQYEPIIESDLRYLYLELNFKMYELKEYFGIGMFSIQKNLSNYGITKPKALIVANRETTNLKVYGCKYSFGSETVKVKTRKTKKERYGDEYYTNRQKARNTMRDLYGCDHYNQTKESKDRHKETCLSKYGVENPFQMEDFTDKCKETWLVKYGVDHPMKSKDIQEISKKTCLEKYGKEYYSQTTEWKIRLTELSQEKFGVDWYTQNSEVKQKLVETCLEKYGTEVAAKSQVVKDKLIETNIERYGAKSFTATELGKEKVKETCLEKFGVENPFQNEEIKYKIKQTCLEKYGVETPSLLPEFQLKADLTKKENGSYGKSEEEDEIYQLLVEKFGKVNRQYSSDLYPYACDFYIPSIDTYIEYQGYWTHGKEPFDKNNPNHIALLESWKIKSKEVNFKNKEKEQYRNAIKVWTVKDMNKRNIAKQNKLNYIEWWNKSEAIKWIKEN